MSFRMIKTEFFLLKIFLINETYAFFYYLKFLHFFFLLPKNEIIFFLRIYHKFKYYTK